MRQIVRDLWVEALESGRYTQCRNFLSRGGAKRCALGVLCEVLADMQAAPASVRLSARRALDDSVSAVPPDVARFAGFPGEVTGPFIRVSAEGEEGLFAVGELNDEGFNFRALARLLREQA